MRPGTGAMNELVREMIEPAPNHIKLDYLDLHADANTAALCLLRRLGNHMTLLICRYYKPPPGAKYWPRYGSCDLGKANRAFRRPRRENW